jgi:hypothetical protein
LSGWATSAASSVLVPIVALSAVLTAAPRIASTITSRTRRSAGSSSKRRSSMPPSAAASALPVAIPAAVASELSPVAFATSAPRKIAGATRVPSTNVAASASPLGGHTAETMSWPSANDRPSFATAK